MKNNICMFLLGAASGIILSVAIVYLKNKPEAKGMGIIESYNAIFIKPDLQKKRWFAAPYQDLKNYNPVTDTILMSRSMGAIIVSKQHVW